MNESPSFTVPAVVHGGSDASTLAPPSLHDSPRYWISVAPDSLIELRLAWNAALSELVPHPVPRFRKTLRLVFDGSVEFAPALLDLVGVLTNREDRRVVGPDDADLREERAPRRGARLVRQVVRPDERRPHRVRHAVQTPGMLLERAAALAYAAWRAEEGELPLPQ